MVAGPRARVRLGGSDDLNRRRAAGAQRVEGAAEGGGRCPVAAPSGKYARASDQRLLDLSENVGQEWRVRRAADRAARAQVTAPTAP